MNGEGNLISPVKPIAFWRRWIWMPILQQLKQGTSPTRLAWSISLGMVLGVFPVMGTTSLLCLLAGWMFKLNQPTLHTFKTLSYPLHLMLIIVFIHLGEWMLGVPVLDLHLGEMLHLFKNDPLQFTKNFALIAVHGVLAWLVIAPFAAYLLKCIAKLIIVKFSRNPLPNKEVAL